VTVTPGSKQILDTLADSGAYQALIAAGAVWASVRRRPYEAAVLGGVVGMFVFNMPANYYYVVLTIIPALIFRGAATATSMTSRYRDFVAFVGFNVFWMFTLISSYVSPDRIVYNFHICALFFGFLVLWIGVWAERGALGELRAEGRVLAVEGTLDVRLGDLERLLLLWREADEQASAEDRSRRYESTSCQHRPTRDARCVIRDATHAVLPRRRARSAPGRATDPRCRSRGCRGRAPPSGRPKNV
jgi:hypothetical protein